MAGNVFQTGDLVRVRGNTHDGNWRVLSATEDTFEAEFVSHNSPFSVPFRGGTRHQFKKSNVEGEWDPVYVPMMGIFAYEVWREVPRA